MLLMTAGALAARCGAIPRGRTLCSTCLRRMTRKATSHPTYPIGQTSLLHLTGYIGLVSAHDTAAYWMLHALDGVL